MKQLGMRLRALREGIGLSQSKFADVIGSTQSSINRYENGQATPTVELLRKYADYFVSGTHWPDHAKEMQP